MRKLVLIGLPVLFILLVGAGLCSYFSPQLTLKAIRDAAKAGDTERLRGLVDFESVRAGLKEDIRATIAKPTARDFEKEPFFAIRRVLATAVVDPVVNSIVTPSTIFQIVSQGEMESKIAAGKARGISPQNDSVGGAPIASSSSAVVVSGEYDGYSRYGVLIRPASAAPDDVIGLTLRRQGFFTWRLSRVLLPESLFEALKDQVAKETHGPREALWERAKMDIRTIESAVKLYKIDNGGYPTTEQGLRALIQKPEMPPVPANWREGGYIEPDEDGNFPKDPWGHPYYYAAPARDWTDYEVMSYGPPGQNTKISSIDQSERKASRLR